MKTLKRFLQDTIIGGLFFLIPLFVILAVGQKIWAVFHDLSGNFAKWLGFGHLLNLASASVLSALAILLTCFVFGLLARWSIASTLRNRFESSLKDAFPPYEYYKAIVERKLALTDKPVRPAVLVRRNGGWQPGIQVEEYANGEKVVFIPLSPRTTDGKVYLVSPEDIRPSSLNERTLNKVLLQQGKGLVP